MRLASDRAFTWRYNGTSTKELSDRTLIPEAVDNVNCAWVNKNDIDTGLISVLSEVVGSFSEGVRRRDLARYSLRHGEGTR